MKKSCNKATVVLAAAAFAVCSQVQAETRWDQVDPASGSTESARALAQTIALGGRQPGPCSTRIYRARRRVEGRSVLHRRSAIGQARQRRRHEPQIRMGDAVRRAGWFN